MVRKVIAVKKYVVTLSDDEREQLNTMIKKGKHQARQQLKARILLKADASDAGEGWSDSQIAAALDTSVDTVARTVNRHAKGTPYRRPKGTPAYRLVPVVHRGDPRDAECPSRG